MAGHLKIGCYEEARTHDSKHREAWETRSDWKYIGKNLYFAGNLEYSPRDKDHNDH